MKWPFGQHEIDFKYADALTTADNIATFRFVVRKVALHHNLHATFMPKPIYGINGSGMHVHQSLFTLEGENAFYDPSTNDQISAIGKHYIGGLLNHARSFCAITNPLVNSFKRPRSRLRSPDPYCLERTQPLAAGARPGPSRKRNPRRTADARPRRQPLLGAGP